MCMFRLRICCDLDRFAASIRHLTTRNGHLSIHINSNDNIFKSEYDPTPKRGGKWGKTAREWLRAHVSRTRPTRTQITTHNRLRLHGFCEKYSPRERRLYILVFMCIKTTMYFVHCTRRITNKSHIDTRSGFDMDS